MKPESPAVCNLPPSSTRFPGIDATPPASRAPRTAKPIDIPHGGMSRGSIAPMRRVTARSRVARTSLRSCAGSLIISSYLDLNYSNMMRADPLRQSNPYLLLGAWEDEDSGRGGKDWINLYPSVTKIAVMDERLLDVIIGLAAFTILIVLLAVLPMVLAGGVGYLAAILGFIFFLSGAGYLVNTKIT